MEGIYFETLTIEFGVAFTCLLFLVAIVSGLFLAGMAEVEKAGTRLLWAEWPIPGTEEVAPPAREKVRLAA
jgi:hypothetical protein